jgi:hypothetical protein
MSHFGAICGAILAQLVDASTRPFPFQEEEGKGLAMPD